MIAVKCSCCGNGMSDEGALVFSPPNGGGSVEKYHICTTCWGVIRKLVESSSVTHQKAQPLVFKAAGT